MLQHQKAACLGSISTAPARQPLLNRPWPKAHTGRAAGLVTQAMNRVEFTKHVHARTVQMKRARVQELNQQDLEEVVKAMFDTIVTAVADAETVSIAGFGKFERRSRRARKARNPATNQSMDLPATVSPGFTPSKQFKDDVKAKDK